MSIPGISGNSNDLTNSLSNYAKKTVEKRLSSYAFGKAKDLFFGSVFGSNEEGKIGKFGIKTKTDLKNRVTNATANDDIKLDQFREMLDENKKNKGAVRLVRVNSTRPRIPADKNKPGTTKSVKLESVKLEKVANVFNFGKIGWLFRWNTSKAHNKALRQLFCDKVMAEWNDFTKAEDSDQQNDVSQMSKLYGDRLVDALSILRMTALDSDYDDENMKMVSKGSRLRRKDIQTVFELQESFFKKEWIEPIVKTCIDRIISDSKDNLKVLQEGGKDVDFDKLCEKYGAFMSKDIFVDDGTKQGKSAQVTQYVLNQLTAKTDKSTPSKSKPKILHDCLKEIKKSLDNAIKACDLEGKIGSYLKNVGDASGDDDGGVKTALDKFLDGNVKQSMGMSDEEYEKIKDDFLTNVMMGADGVLGRNARSVIQAELTSHKGNERAQQLAAKQTAAGVADLFRMYVGHVKKFKSAENPSKRPVLRNVLDVLLGSYFSLDNHHIHIALTGNNSETDRARNQVASVQNELVMLFRLFPDVLRDYQYDGRFCVSSKSPEEVEKLLAKIKAEAKEKPLLASGADSKSNSEVLDRFRLKKILEHAQINVDNFLNEPTYVAKYKEWVNGKSEGNTKVDAKIDEFADAETVATTVQDMMARILADQERIIVEQIDNHYVALKFLLDMGIMSDASYMEPINDVAKKIRSTLNNELLDQLCSSLSDSSGNTVQSIREEFRTAAICRFVRLIPDNYLKASPDPEKEAKNIRYLQDHVLLINAFLETVVDSCVEHCKPFIGREGGAAQVKTNLENFIVNLWNYCFKKMMWLKENKMVTEGLTNCKNGISGWNTNGYITTKIKAANCEYSFELLPSAVRQHAFRSFLEFDLRDLIQQVGMNGWDEGKLSAELDKRLGLHIKCAVSEGIRDSEKHFYSSTLDLQDNVDGKDTLMDKYNMILERIRAKNQATHEGVKSENMEMHAVTENKPEGEKAEIKNPKSGGGEISDANVKQGAADPAKKSDETNDSKDAAQGGGGQFEISDKKVEQGVADPVKKSDEANASTGAAQGGGEQFEMNIANEENDLSKIASTQALISDNMSGGLKEYLNTNSIEGYHPLNTRERDTLLGETMKRIWIHTVVENSPGSDSNALSKFIWEKIVLPHRMKRASGKTLDEKERNALKANQTKLTESYCDLLTKKFRQSMDGNVKNYVAFERKVVTAGRELVCSVLNELEKLGQEAQKEKQSGEKNVKQKQYHALLEYCGLKDSQMKRLTPADKERFADRILQRNNSGLIKLMTQYVKAPDAFDKLPEGDVKELVARLLNMTSEGGPTAVLNTQNHCILCAIKDVVKTINTLSKDISAASGPLNENGKETRKTLVDDLTGEVSKNVKDLQIQVPEALIRGLVEEQVKAFEARPFELPWSITDAQTLRVYLIEQVTNKCSDIIRKEGDLCTVFGDFEKACQKYRKEIQKALEEPEESTLKEPKNNTEEPTQKKQTINTDVTVTNEAQNIRAALLHCVIASSKDQRRTLKECLKDDGVKYYAEELIKSLAGSKKPLIAKTEDSISRVLQDAEEVFRLSGKFNLSYDECAAVSQRYAEKYINDIADGFQKAACAEQKQVDEKYNEIEENSKNAIGLSSQQLKNLKENADTLLEKIQDPRIGEAALKDALDDVNAFRRKEAGEASTVDNVKQQIAEQLQGEIGKHLLQETLVDLEKDSVYRRMRRELLESWVTKTEKETEKEVASFDEAVAKLCEYKRKYIREKCLVVAANRVIRDQADMMFAEIVKRQSDAYDMLDGAENITEETWKSWQTMCEQTLKRLQISYEQSKFDMQTLVDKCNSNLRGLEELRKKSNMVFRDQTSRPRAEKWVKENEEYLRNVFPAYFNAAMSLRMRAHIKDVEPVNPKLDNPVVKSLADGLFDDFKKSIVEHLVTVEDMDGGTNQETYQSELIKTTKSLDENLIQQFSGYVSSAVHKNEELNEVAINAVAGALVPMMIVNVADLTSTDKLKAILNNLMASMSGVSGFKNPLYTLKERMLDEKLEREKKDKLARVYNALSMLNDLRRDAVYLSCAEMEASNMAANVGSGLFLRLKQEEEKSKKMIEGLTVLFQEQELMRGIGLGDNKEGGAK